MTIGIYSLWWEEENLVYIGQSIDIERRFKEHKRELEKGSHCNYKLQNAYNSYGSPEYIILEKCDSNSLFYLEQLYTEEFDSLRSGLNIVEPGIVGNGVNSNNSKYSKITVLKVFISIYKYKRTRSYISKSYKIPQDLVKRIATGKSHLWLKQLYPDKYKIMKEVSTKIRSNNTNVNKIKLSIEDPNGNTHVIHGSLAAFCRSVPDFKDDWFTASGVLSQMKAGKRKSYKNWKNLKQL